MHTPAQAGGGFLAGPVSDDHRQRAGGAGPGRHAGKIIAFASSAPCGGDEFLKELERAVAGDGLKGVWVTSSLQGAYPDDDTARPFFKLVTDLDIPVVIHPPSIGFGEERMNVYRLASSVGRPFDNALALARLIVRGIFEQFPSLKLVGSHLGGDAPPLTVLKPRGLKMVDELGLDAADKDKVPSGNASKLLKLN